MKYDLLGKAVRRFRLPVVDFTNAPVIIVPVQQGDVNSRFFEIALYDDRGDIDLSAYTRAIINGVTPSGITLTSDKCEIKEDGSAVIVNFGGGFATSPGKITCQVLFTNSEENVALTTQSFYVIVSESQFDKIVMENEENCNELLSLLEEVEGVERQIESAEEQRVAAENERKAAELVRQENEQNRINAELERNEFEQERTSKENERNAQEQVRIENENKRAQNEGERANAEEARANAEVARVEAEIKRENDFVAAKDNVNAVVADIAQKLENGEFVGEKGETGKSAFEIAVENGFEGSETEWLESLNGNDGVSISEINTGRFEIVGKNTVTPITIIKTDGSSHTFKVEARNGEGANNIAPNVELLWEGEKGEEEFFSRIKIDSDYDDSANIFSTWKLLDTISLKVGDILKIEAHNYTKATSCYPYHNRADYIMRFKCIEVESIKLSDLLIESGLEDQLIEDEGEQIISNYYFSIEDLMEATFEGVMNGQGGNYWQSAHFKECYILGGEISAGNYDALFKFFDRIGVDFKEIGGEDLNIYKGLNFVFNQYISHGENEEDAEKEKWWKYNQENSNENKTALLIKKAAINDGQYHSSFRGQLGIYTGCMREEKNEPIKITKVSLIRG